MILIFRLIIMSAHVRRSHYLHQALRVLQYETEDVDQSAGRSGCLLVAGMTSWYDMNTST